MSTFDKVKNITVEQLSVDPEEVKMESSFLTKKQKKSALLRTQLKCWMKKNNLSAVWREALSLPAKF